MATDVAPQVQPELDPPKAQIRRPFPPLFCRPEGWLVFVIAFGLAIRLYRLDQRSIWFDEASSWRTTRFPVGEMIERVAANCHPPLYYLCLKGWSGLFGESLLALRGMSVAFAGVLMLGAYLFVRALYDVGDGASGGEASGRWGGRWLAVFAAALVAFSPFQIRMSWEARMYMLGAALAAVSSWLMVVAWQRRDSPRLWLGYGLSALLLAYTHYFGLFTIFAQFLFLGMAIAVEHQGNLRSLLTQPELRGAGLSLLLVTLGWLPWLPTFLAQRQQIDEHWWTGPFRIESLLNVSRTMLLGEGGRGWLTIVSACAIIAIVALLLIRGAVRDALLGFLIVCPVMLSVAYSVEFRNIIVDRYFVFTQVFVLCGVAVLIGRIPHLIPRITAATLLIVWTAAAYYDMWSRMDIPNRPGTAGAAAHVLNSSERREPVVVSSPLIYYPMLYHLRGEMDCRLFHSGNLAHNAGGPFSMPEDFITAVEMSHIGCGRAWVVTGGWKDLPVSVPTQWTHVRSEQFREVFSFQGQIMVDEYFIAASAEELTTHK